jgi:integrin beta 3
MTETETIAQVIVASVRAAMGPYVADVKVLQSQLATWEARWGDLGALRERVAVVESKSQHRSGLAPEPTLSVDLLAPVLARVEALETRVDGDAVRLEGYVANLQRDVAADTDRLAAVEARPHLTPELRESIAESAINICRRLDALETKAPAPGVDGKDGRDGLNGTDGANGLDGKDGANGRDGNDGRDGQPGVPGVAGRDGAPGERGEKGLDGAPGRDGTLEALRVEAVDERTWRLVRADGTPIDGATLAFTVPLYRGVYAAGTSYAKGDAVTFGGSLWIAREATSAKPGDGATAWQLAVKAGREGREGKPGAPGVNGAKGERGEPGRDYR